jgi:hypothetical protein
LRDVVAGDVPDLQTELNDLIREVSDSRAPIVVLSSEVFFDTKVDSIRLIKQALSNFIIKIVAIIRRPDELFCSIYNQKAKNPKNEFKTHYSEFLDNPKILSSDLQFDTALERWASVFGQEQILVECYEANSTSIALVCDLMEIPLDGFDLTKIGELNRRMSVKGIEVMRQAKIAGLNEPVRRRLFEIASKWLPPSNDGTESLMTPDERVAVLKKMDSITNQVFEKYLKRPNAYSSSRLAAWMLPYKTHLTIDDTVKLLGKVIETAGKFDVTRAVSER